MNAKEMLISLKAVMRSYRRMDASTQHKLKRLGFNVVEGRKHYHIYRNGDTHRSYTLSKTPGDYRDGINSAIQMYKILVV